MTIRYAVAAVTALMTAGAGVASAQPYYGYGQLPPAPYEEQGGYAGGYSGGCGNGSFTLLGARAGVTVLGFDLGAGAHFSAPTGEGCGGGYAPSYAPAAVAPPPAPMAYAPPAYGYGYQPQGYGPQPYGYAEQGYGQPMPAPAPAWGYGAPCGCQGQGW